MLVPVIVAAVVFAFNATRGQPPEAVALEYGRALYASDAEALWRLLSDEDRRAKDEATLRRQQHDLDGFARDALRQLVPVTFAPGETREFTSEYLLLADTPRTVRTLDVTYALPATTAALTAPASPSRSDSR